MTTPQDIQQRRKGGLKTALVLLVVALAVYLTFVGSVMLGQ